MNIEKGIKFRTFFKNLIVEKNGNYMYLSLPYEKNNEIVYSNKTVKIDNELLDYFLKNAIISNEMLDKSVGEEIGEVHIYKSQREYKVVYMINEYKGKELFCFELRKLLKPGHILDELIKE